MMTHEEWGPVPTAAGGVVRNECGSTWRIWDLHIHTPASISHEYGGVDPWDEFLADLRNLPAEISVVGINDYLFVDGYARVLREHALGNLPNLTAIFPVIELRIDQFGGTEGRLSRINWHVIFDQGMDPEVIESRFINGLSAKYQIDPGYEGAPWSGFLTRENLRSLGSEVRASVRPDRQGEFHESNLQIGFNNLNFKLEAVQEILSMTALRGRSLCAVGKTEWSSVRWSAQSQASKRSIINQADLVFTAAQSVEDYERSRDRLKADRVNYRLFDCSDAHRSRSAPPGPNRLGDVKTWVNAEPTLDGLRHALIEFETRVYVGSEPAKVTALKQRPADHIASVEIRPKPGGPDTNIFFDLKVPLNPGFVAVVGNKGKGKSALLDMIGLAANSREQDNFSFLRKDRFLDQRDRFGEQYEVTLRFANDVSCTKSLAAGVDGQAVERATYIPQRLLDDICGATPSDATGKFTQRLSSVLFAHVPTQERLGAADLESLIARRTTALDERIESLRGEVKTLNAEIVRTINKAKPDRIRAIRSRLESVERKISDLDLRRPLLPTPPTTAGEGDAGPQADLRAKREERASLLREAEALRAEDSDCAVRINLLEQMRTAVQTLQGQYEAFAASNAPRANRVEVDLATVVQLVVNLTPVESTIRSLSQRRVLIASGLSVEIEGSVQQRIEKIESQVLELERDLDEPARRYATAVQELEEWESAREELIAGSVEQEGHAALQAMLAEVGNMSGLQRDLEAQRLVKLRDIYSSLQLKVSVLNDLYAPARQFIAAHPLAQQSGLEFAAALGPANLEERFWDVVLRNVSGSFFGVAEGADALRSMVEQADFNDSESVVEFTARVAGALSRDPSSNAVDPERAIRKGRKAEEVLDLIFGLEFVEPFHRLEYNGRPLEQLSPGQKGTLLLMFYLLVDPERKPLLLDQPDENLDNQTVKNLLAPAIKEASGRRQVIIVTHNPNVAVVADADQVIAADLQDGQFSYVGGAIEDTLMNGHVVDILEGTWPAFNNRGDKYRPPLTHN